MAYCTFIVGSLFYLKRNQDLLSASKNRLPPLFVGPAATAAWGEDGEGRYGKMAG